MSLWNPANDGLLRALAEGAHAAGAAVLSQATHMGRRASSVASGVPLQAPSAVAEAVHREVPGRLHATDIDRIVACFAAAAVRLQACGWDGIEITSFGGHLIEQFWSPSVHRRTDRYRGSFENRTRFAVEVLEAIGRAVRDDFLVSFRMTADPATPELGLDPDDMPEIAARLDRVGRVDRFDISGGTGATLLAQAGTVPPDHLPEKVYNPLARAVREVVSAPVLVAGRILTPEAGEASLVAGDADLVAMTRAIIADPDLPAKTRRGERDRIRPCIAINESCIGRLYSGMPSAARSIRSCATLDGCRLRRPIRAACWCRAGARPGWRRPGWPRSAVIGSSSGSASESLAVRCAGRPGCPTDRAWGGTFPGSPASFGA